MGYNYSFRENQSYNAADLNGVSGDFNSVVGTDFKDGVAYGVDQLNLIRADMVSAGIAKGVGSMCSCSNDGSKIKIGSGKVFFENGIRLEIDADGITVPYTLGTAGTVWLEYMQALGDVALRFTQTAPSGMFVKIAEVSTSGVVTDARQYCYMKNETLLPSRNHIYRGSVVVSTSTISGDTPAVTLKVDSTGYQYMHISTNSFGTTSALYGFSPLTLHSVHANYGHGIYSSDTNKGFCTYVDSNQYDFTYIRATYENDVVKFYVTDAGSPGTVTLNIIMF